MHGACGGNLQLSPYRKIKTIGTIATFTIFQNETANPVNHLDAKLPRCYMVACIMLRPICMFTDLQAESQSEHLGFAVGGKCANTVRKSVMT